MKRTITLGGLLLPVVMILSACTTTTPIKMNSVAIIDTSLQSLQGDVISVETTTSRRTPTGTVEAIAVLRNRTDSPIQVEGRIQFFDDQKIPVESPTAWQRIFLNPNSVETFRGYSSKVEGIHDFYIELREGR